MKLKSKNNPIFLNHTSHRPLMDMYGQTRMGHFCLRQMFWQESWLNMWKKLDQMTLFWWGRWYKWWFSVADSDIIYINHVLTFLFLCLGSILFQPGFYKSSLGFRFGLFRYEYISLNRMRSHVIRWERDKLVSTFHRGWIHITVFCWHGIVDNKKETVENSRKA